MIYRDRLVVDYSATWRKGFNVLIDSKAKVTIGKNCFFNNYCSINAIESVKIGDGCLFGENVKIYDHNHCFRNPNVPIKEQGYSVGEVIIGNRCWIGSNVIILKGVHIGDNVVISAGTVVRDSVPSNKIVKANQTVEYIDFSF